MDAQVAEAKAVVTEESALDRILEAYGHVPPPENYITVDSYVERARERGCALSSRAAERALTREYRAGRLARRKFVVDGFVRWVYWSTE